MPSSSRDPAVERHPRRVLAERHRPGLLRHDVQRPLALQLAERQAHRLAQRGVALAPPGAQAAGGGDQPRMAAHPLPRQPVRPEDPRVRVDLDQRAARLLDAALHHHHAADLPGAVDPVEDPELALAILAGVAADLVEGHPGHVPVDDDVDLFPADAPGEGVLLRKSLHDLPDPRGDRVPAFVHPHAERGEGLHPPGLRRLHPVARQRLEIPLQPSLGLGADHRQDRGPVSLAVVHPAVPYGNGSQHSMVGLLEHDGTSYLGDADKQHDHAGGRGD